MNLNSLVPPQIRVGSGLLETESFACCSNAWVFKGVPGAAASVSPENSFEMQNLRSHHRSIKSETLGWGAQSASTSPAGHSGAAEA